jgi:hypothetical protein
VGSVDQGRYPVAAFERPVRDVAAPRPVRTRADALDDVVEILALPDDALGPVLPIIILDTGAVRAGPSRGQAHHATDTRLQGLPLCANHSKWRRAYAHDPQRADARRRERSVRSAAILNAGGVTPTGSLTRGEAVQPTLTRAAPNATEPTLASAAPKGLSVSPFYWRVLSAPNR